MNLYNQTPQVNQGFQGQQNNIPDYLNKVSQSEFVTLGFNAGRDAFSKHTDKLTTGASGVWNSLRFYFSVSNSYVSKKMFTVLYPLSNTVWNRLSSDEFERVGEPSLYSRKWALPRQDPNAPDLYIPLMSFITYVLLYGLGKGLRLDSTTFSPDIIIQAVWRCLILQLFESGLILVATNLLGAPVLFSDIFAYSGYKYVGLCVNTLSRGLGGSVNFLVSLYTAGMFAYFVLKTMAAAVPVVPNTSGPPRHLIVLGIAGLQFAVMLILSWL